MTPRAHIPLKTKLAATLLQMLRVTDDGQFVRQISHEEAKRLTADEIISRFHFDHQPIPHAQGGPDEPWNLTPLPVDEHREKTARQDLPQIAKSKRVARSEEEIRPRILAKGRGEAKPKSKWPSRGFQKREKA